MILPTILLISFLVRIPRFDYPISGIFIWGDGTRDYLVANHILTYHQFPLTGPYNYFFDNGIVNSPLYFYLLAILLIPFNNILSLSLINISLQILTLLLIYFIGKRIFSRNVAILGTTIYSLNPEIIKFADFIWQPSLMQPVILLALYFLIRPQTNLLFLQIGLVLFSLALTIHNTALSWLPIFIVLTFLILKKLKKSLIYSFATLSIIPLSLIIFHSPLFFFYKVNTDFKISLDFLNINLLSYFPNLNANLEVFFKIFYLNWAVGLILLILILAIYPKPKFLPVSLFILPIIFSSFLSKVRFHYLILSAPFFVLLLVSTIDHFFKRLRWLKISMIVVVFLVFNGNSLFLNSFKKPLQNYNLTLNVVDKISKDLQDIKDQNNFKNYDFFQVNSLVDNNGIFTYPVLDTIFLSPLEKRLNTKLAQLSDTSPYNHVQKNSKDYLVVSCFRIKLELCQKEFQEKNFRYSLVKIIYEGSKFSVFLAKLGV